jgi:myo-inositol 2-dehydrogenase/D-chiro-inositol 1-dehydrogenase
VRDVPDANLVAIADPDLEAARACADALGIEHVFDDPEAIWDDEGIDAVVIASATHTHAEFIVYAARAGKHVFCEKPISHDLEEIDAALDAVERNDVKLQIGFNRRFDPTFREVKEAVDEGRIGVPHLLRITSRDPAPPPIEYVRVSGGLFFDMTIHDFDMARHLCGEVLRVHAVGGVRVDPEIEEVGDIDTAIVTLEFENGVFGTIDNSRQAVYGYDQRVEVFGSEGVVMADNETPSRTRVADENGVHAPLPLHFFMERYTESYRAELEAFVDAILSGEEPPVTGIDGRRPVVMAMAAQKSLDECRPVAIDEID